MLLRALQVGCQLLHLLLLLFQSSLSLVKVVRYLKQSGRSLVQQQVQANSLFVRHFPFSMHALHLVTRLPYRRPHARLHRHHSSVIIKRTYCVKSLRCVQSEVRFSDYQQLSALNLAFTSPKSPPSASGDPGGMGMCGIELSGVWWEPRGSIRSPVIAASSTMVARMEADCLRDPGSGGVPVLESTLPGWL
eukprot:CAMPEP_0184490212 /NCGR_PEP_ID=MMETSP0113_2-20130426/17315_1 /TAXON_ID=91329 /ORGANISM="Norrisiella sphaerica, Strain BC52" /LENGTH=190 /DNA_ID=CAMNT_0026873995 /DNA_START=83 /DNA_END=656 /DNA_ORIENTATION=+